LPAPENRLETNGLLRFPGDIMSLQKSSLHSLRRVGSIRKAFR
jgi:hypothetical protein